MYIETSTEYQNHPCIISMLEALTAGGTIATADFDTDIVDELEPGAIVGKDSNGLYHLLKTAAIVAGGSASAPRIGKDHSFIVGDFISDGVVALEISAITVGVTYDTLGFTSGSLSISAVDTILHKALAEDLTSQARVAAATVTDTIDQTLTVTVPVASDPAKFNGLSLTIEQAADDVLAVAFTGGVLTLSLAATTAANNNIAEIQAAIRALGEVDGYDLSAVTTSEVNWDGSQTGATLTVATDVFEGGVDQTGTGRVDFIYTPVGVTITTVNLTLANQTSGIMVRGSVKEANLPYQVDADIKALLPLIRFE
jgi:hypothetical protein